MNILLQLLICESVSLCTDNICLNLLYTAVEVTFLYRCRYLEYTASTGKKSLKVWHNLHKKVITSLYLDLDLIIDHDQGNDILSNFMNTKMK